MAFPETGGLVTGDGLPNLGFGMLGRVIGYAWSRIGDGYSTDLLDPAVGSRKLDVVSVPAARKAEITYQLVSISHQRRPWRAELGWA